MKIISEHYPGELNISFGNFKRLISGKGSLRAAFWGIWFFGAGLFAILFHLIVMAYSEYTNNLDILNWRDKYEDLALCLYLTLAYPVVWKNTICLNWCWIPITRIFITTVVLKFLYDAFTFT